MSSPLAHFSSLDDVIQVIYHLNRQLFLLSKVQNDEWVLHIGLLGSDSRWWRGKWDEEDVLAVAGSKSSSDDLLEMSEKLLEYIVQGELFLSGWSKESISFKARPFTSSLILGPSSDKPSHFQLNEISAEDAACYAAEVFCSIARDAQARKCQLYGPSFADVSTTHLNETVVPSSSESFANSGLGTSIKKREEPKSKMVAEQPAPSKKRKEQKEETQSPIPEAKTKAKGAPKPIKGASLANPTKKARKYQAVQFDSDED
ncbi:hypothetical protein F5876DRAFT_65803 [Lentinula aff. lateritia]|uniref:Uncharacterized protein n=1 Tax=Lentinula aff. lateritia TaxID=2804960 RepID=A0ACC1TZK7_9AGAR|nr:hypothetical protein F5876DRAFT_65803 [Lentinula aff. lateritia]